MCTRHLLIIGDYISVEFRNKVQTKDVILRTISAEIVLKGLRLHRIT